jgi:hypothetical protein
MSDKSLKDAAASGLYHLPPRAAAWPSKRAPSPCYVSACSRLDIARGHRSKARLSQLGNALNFPIWYGANFDALYDCLCDPKTGNRPRGMCW